MNKEKINSITYSITKVISRASIALLLLAVLLVLLVFLSFANSFQEPPWHFASLALLTGCCVATFFRVILGRRFSRKWQAGMVALVLTVTISLNQISKHNVGRRIFETYFDQALPSDIKIVSGFHGAWIDQTAELELKANSSSAFEKLLDGFYPITVGEAQGRFTFSSISSGNLLLKQEGTRIFMRETDEELEYKTDQAKWSRVQDFILLDSKLPKAYYFKKFKFYYQEKPRLSTRPHL